MIIMIMLSLQDSTCIGLLDLNIGVVGKFVLSAFGYISNGAMRRGSRLARCHAAMQAMPLSSFLPSFLFPALSRNGMNLGSDSRSHSVTHSKGG